MNEKRHIGEEGVAKKTTGRRESPWRFMGTDFCEGGGKQKKKT